MLRTYVTLARWLGPWGPETRAPKGVVRREVELGAGNRAVFYRPEHIEPVAAYLISIGVHFNGPDDPRMDRFARILGAAGIATLIPELREFKRLRVRPAVVEDLEAGFDWLLDCDEVARKPGILSISFGSFPALRVAAARGDAVERVIVFGGYADFAETVEFCLSGEIEGRPHVHHDPLNIPVAFISLVSAMDDVPEDTGLLEDAWVRYCEQTWGQEDMKRRAGLRNDVARKIAADLPEEQRWLFLQGCGAEPGGVQRCREAMRRWKDRAAELDPRPYLATVRAPVHLVHGIDDDVIPYNQAKKLRAALPEQAAASVHLTGLFGHSGSSGLVGLLRRIPSAVRELATLVRIVRALGHEARPRSGTD